MISVPQFFFNVGASVSGGIGPGEGQAAWQIWGLACRMVLFGIDPLCGAGPQIVVSSNVVSMRANFRKPIPAPPERPRLRRRGRAHICYP